MKDMFLGGLFVFLGASSCIGEANPPSTPTPGSASAARPATGRPFSPLPSPKQAGGTVLQVMPAGSYAYVLVAQPHGAFLWVATLGAGPRLGDVVDVTVYAEKDEFFSKRLQQTFAPLAFGALTVTSGSVSSEPLR